MGLHSAPCLSVTLNERADYFGTTVNTAARARARGGDIVLTEAVRADPEAEAMLAGLALESSTATLKGIDGVVRVHRVTVDTYPMR